MKKLIVAFAAAAMAFGVQAATVQWSTGVFDGPNGTSSKTGSKYSGVYEATFTAWTFVNEGGTDVRYDYGPSTTQDTKKTGVMSGSVDVFEPASGVTQTYYSQLVITEIATGKTLESSTGTFTYTGGDLASPDVTFYGSGAGGWAAGGAPSASAGGWTAAPEPTSGLLMLIGLGALALRRKRA